jgi:predicted amidohydrolase YtcJ
MKKVAFPLLLLVSSILLCIAFKKDVEDSPDIILKNAKVYTMNGTSPEYEAIGIKDGKVKYLGTNKKVLAYKSPRTTVVDCHQAAIFPGFIDAHAHIGQNVFSELMVNLNGTPYGHVNSIGILQDTLRAYISRNYPDLQDTAYVTGNGYDDAVLDGHKQPTKEDLDKVSTTHPIYVIHTSGHMGVANSILLEKMGIDEHTPDPQGGTIVKVDGKLTGLLLENAHNRAVQYLVSKMTVSPAVLIQNLLKSEKIWFSYGITTFCEGKADYSTIQLIKAANDMNLLTGDFIVLPDFDNNRYRLNEFVPYYNKYDKHFKVGAVKFTFDGSPQGRSAALTEKYLHPPVGQQDGFKGLLAYPTDSARKFLREVFRTGMPVHLHCNGDAAIDQGLGLLESLYKEKVIPPGARNVLVHSQVCRPDQVKRFAKDKAYVMPSWFPTHCYIWGDWHRDTVLGNDRASRISPLKEGLDNNIIFTIHTDAPVTPPDLLTAVYSAVNRKTLTGQTLGAEQKIAAYEAMKAITVNGAYQWSEEKSGKGRIMVDGPADFAILDQSPFDIATDNIKDIKVLYTYKDGKLVYQHPSIN